MKKILSIFTVLVIIATTICVACKKGNDLPATKKTTHLAARENNNSIVLTDEQIENIGEAHNSFLRTILLSKNCTTWTDADFKSTFKESYTTETVLNGTQKDNLLNLDYSKESVLSKISDDKLKTMLNNTDEYIKTNTYNLAELCDFLNSQITEAREELSDNDFQTFKVYVSTVKHSAKLWMPHSLGGDEITLEIPNVPSSSAINWTLVVAADGMGAVGSLLAIAFLITVPTPVTLGALAVCIGWDAAYASGAEFLFQLRNQ